MSEAGLISILAMRLSYSSKRSSASVFEEDMTVLEMFPSDFTSLTMQSHSKEGTGVEEESQRAPP
jgi:hypothetical protein